MSEVDQGPSDDELLNEVLSDEEAPDNPVVAEAEQVEEPIEGAETVAEQVDEKPPIPPKPEWRLREDAERARAAEAELANERAEKAALRQRLEALERGKEPAKEETDDSPDPLLDPKGYAKHVREQIREEMLTERREDSMKAAQEANPEAFGEAYKASVEAMRSGDVSIRARMHNARDPGKELLKWHKEQKVKAEVGDDIEAYVERKVQERIAANARPNAQTQQPDGRPRTSLPPSLNGASRANTTLKSTVDDVTDDQLFRELAG